MPSRWLIVVLVVAVVLTGCSKEARPVGPSQPLSAPTGALDPRIEQYQQNAWQVSQGGRYYIWYGCSGCHAGGMKGPDLGLGRWRHGSAFDAVYASISHGHTGGLARVGHDIPVEQLWQITAYVRELPTLDPQKRRRQDKDNANEPAGRTARASTQ